jgi:hypothetical protein
MANNKYRSVRIDVPRSANIDEVRYECCDLLTGIYDTSIYPHSILVDQGNEWVAQQRLRDKDVLSSVKPQEE